ncbi:MAG: sodium/glutamate symporter [Gammaproteobacteria bacterium]|nr:sodium/glutamate symporter [Gammaproteobacteria bacterium]
MLELNVRQTLILAILVLFLGRFLTHRINFLRIYNIPEPVSGGIIASLLTAIIYFSADTELVFNLGARDTLLIVFFTCIGLSSRISTLIEGGASLLILLVLAVAYLFLQNFTGLAAVAPTALPTEVGLIGGSVSLSGGHGTAIAWAQIFVDDYGIGNALEIGIACATFGLVLGGLMGGPIANFLITRNKLESVEAERPSVGIPYDDAHIRIDVDNMLNALFVIAIAVGLGLQINELLTWAGLRLPQFVTSLFAGIVLTNTIPFLFGRMRWPTGTPTLALISDLSLSLFLAMSLMSLQLWTLLGLGGPLLLLLVAQVMVVTLFVVVVVFNAMGRSYDAAVMSAGYVGLALGATPTAIANMTAVTKSFGSSSRAFIVVPLVGAFFIDIANALIIQFMLDRLS